ncbi:MAG: peptide deformylase [Chloroflexota bacterium]|nr:peptide deformylase [Chloroflexota bacterium]
MAIRRILQMEHPGDLRTLKRKSARVSQFDGELAVLVEDMIETMRSADGVGLSAPQVGVLRRVVTMEMPGEYEEQEDGSFTESKPPQLYILVNPEIVKIADERLPMLEGCLSLPGRFGDVERAPWTHIKYRDLKGKEQRLKATDHLLSQCIQHEIDHLDGILFTERLADITALRDERRKPKRSRFLRPRQENPVAGEVVAPEPVAPGA